MMNRSGSQLLANIRRERQDRLKQKTKESKSPSCQPSATTSVKKTVKFDETVVKPKTERKIESFHVMKSSALIRSVLKSMPIEEAQKFVTSRVPLSFAKPHSDLPLSPSSDRMLSVSPRRTRNHAGLVSIVPRKGGIAMQPRPHPRDNGYAPGLLNDVRLDVDGYVIPPPPPLSDGALGTDDLTHFDDESDLVTTLSELSRHAQTRLNTMSLCDQTGRGNGAHSVPFYDLSVAASVDGGDKQPTLRRVGSQTSVASVASTLTATTTRSYSGGYSYSGGKGLPGAVDSGDAMSCFSGTGSESASGSADGRSSPSPFKYKILTSPLNAKSINSTVKVPKRGATAVGTATKTSAHVGVQSAMSAQPTSSSESVVSISEALNSAMSSAISSPGSIASSRAVGDSENDGSYLCSPPSRYAMGVLAGASLVPLSPADRPRPKRAPPKRPV
jgi:hypothetical protein